MQEIVDPFLSTRTSVDVVLPAVPTSTVIRISKSTIMSSACDELLKLLEQAGAARVTRFHEQLQRERNPRILSSSRSEHAKLVRSNITGIENFLSCASADPGVLVRQSSIFRRADSDGYTQSTGRSYMYDIDHDSHEDTNNAKCVETESDSRQICTTPANQPVRKCNKNTTR